MEINKNKPKMLIMDLDRTLVNSDERTKKWTLENGKLDFENLHIGILEMDKINLTALNLFLALFYVFQDSFTDIRVVFLSGRNHNARKETLEFIKREFISFTNETYWDYLNKYDKMSLILRNTDDYRANHEFKREKLIELQKENDIKWFIDDDISCCSEATKLGIPALCFMSDNVLDDYTKGNIIKFVDKELK